MSNYINIYNNLIRLTTNKKLYDGFDKQDTFSDRLILFLIHFAFFLKAYKSKETTAILQEIYDFNFRQLELSIREIGYGDQSINKKMKDYLNLFHSIINEVHFWEKLTFDEKKNKISSFFDDSVKNDYLVEYFDTFEADLSKKNLNFFLKRVDSS